MAGFRRAAGLIAAILVLAAGVGLAAAGMPLIGVPLATVGLALTVWQGRVYWATRSRRDDPYDLSKLWDYPIEDVPDEDLEERARAVAESADRSGTLYCHICGHAVPDLYAHCPECGQRLR